jgi:hypothetical protein
LTGAFINNLWNAIPHPPQTSLGTKYKYREADGSNNNIRSPELGMANTPYARAAKPSTLQNIALPDPGVIFDGLMARWEKFEPHPNKISSMLFYLATIIIHDIFRTVSLLFRISEKILIRNRIIKTLTIRWPAATSISLHCRKHPERARPRSNLQRWEAQARLLFREEDSRLTSWSRSCRHHVQSIFTIMLSLNLLCKTITLFQRFEKFNELQDQRKWSIQYTKGWSCQSCLGEIW